MERHLEPLAIATNITQATHCRLDTVLLMFGYLIRQYQAMADRDIEDRIGCDAILNSLEKCWLATDQLIFIAAVIVNLFFWTTQFAPHPHVINSRIKSFLTSLFNRFFQLEVPNAFHTELREFSMGSGQYSELRSTCARHMYNGTHEVHKVFVPSALADTYQL